MVAQLSIETIRASVLDWIEAWRVGRSSGGNTSQFDALALALFAWQYEHIEAYRAWCDHQGRRPSTVKDVGEIPLVPVAAFKRRVLSSEEAKIASAAVFETSGTSDGAPGRVILGETRVYDDSLRAAFQRFVLPDGRPGSHRCLSLVPGPGLRPRSSLGHMVRVLRDRWDDGGGGDYLRADSERDDRGELDVVGLARDLKTACEQRLPVLLLTTSIALEMMLEAWPRGLCLRLPAGSRVMDTGGPKGRRRELDRGQQHRALVEILGITLSDIVGELGMTELGSQRYETVARAEIVGDLPARRVYTGPPWLRSVVLEPGTLRPLPLGELGIVGHIDLVNLDTCAFILTADLAREVRVGEALVGLELAGRVPGSEWRGCGLDVEDLL